MRKITKKISAVLSLLLASGCVVPFTACGRSGFTEKVDKTKTQLIISNFEGGFGSEWLYKVKDAFELANEGKRYEDGKTGVQILIDGNKTKGDQFDWMTTSAHVAFIEQMPTETLLSMGANGQLLKLNDVMASILAQDGVSIDEDLLGTLKVLDGESIYQIPHYEGAGGIVYDKDLFDEYSLYISATGGWTNASGNLSVGGDGETGTLDDGLPATYVELFKMCDRMQQNSITPFIISGEWKGNYGGFILNGAATSYNGEETTKAFLRMDGSQGKYISETTESNGYFGYDVTTETASITAENGYLKEQSPGRLYALEMWNKIISKKYYHIGGWASTISHLDAQDMYLKSTKKNEPIAMLIDENEATAVFDSMGATNANFKKENRNFGFMPFPTKVDANDTNDSTDSMKYVDHLNAVAMVRSDISPAVQNLAKDFLKYCYTPENLEAFTAQTGTTRALQYNISDDTFNGLTPYQKDLWTLHKNGAFISKNSDSQFYGNNDTSVFLNPWQSPTYNSSTTMFSTKGNTVTALQFFKSFWMTQSEWDAKVVK